MLYFKHVYPSASVLYFTSVLYDFTYVLSPVVSGPNALLSLFCLFERLALFFQHPVFPVLSARL